MSVTVTVNGQPGPSVVASTGDTVTATITAASVVAVTASPAAAPGGIGPSGPANTLAIGTVTSGTAAATITGAAPSQTLNLVLPVGSTGATGSVGATGSQGPAGPANTLSIGTVTSGTAAATITGTSPSQTLNLVLPVGATGATGATGAAGPAANLADETPQPLGTASAGTALSAARADHVHAVGSITYSALSGIPSTFAPSAHAHAVSDVTGLQTALDGKQASGTYATLVSGTVPSSQLPSYVDDVIEYANLAAFSEQSTGKIYVARDTGKIYRWSGSAYIEISPSPGSTDSVTEGSTNLYFTNTRAAAAAPVQSVSGRTGAIALTSSDVGLGNVTNTSDANKPVSTAQASADAAVQAFSIQRANHTGTQAASTISDFATEAAKYGPVTSVSGRTGTITVAKSDVGLGSVDNTADTAKPVSTAQAAADAAVQAFAIQRTNHTGTQAASTITGLSSIATSGSASDLASGTVPAARLPVATDTTAGAITVGTGLAISSGVLSATGGGSYSLPTATSSVLGGVKVGANLTITDGVLAATGGGGSDSRWDLFLPPAPTSLVATAGNAQVALSWTATTVLAQTPITDYTVQYSSDSGSTWTTFADGTSTATSATVTGLTNGTAYTFRVAAVNGVGTGSYSAASSSATPRTVPGAPTNVAANPYGPNVALNWTDPASNGGSAITGYVVQFSVDGSSWITTTLTPLSGYRGYFDGDTERFSYTFRVAAVNSVGTGSFSSPSNPVGWA